MASSTRGAAVSNKIHVRHVSTLSIVLTVVLSIACATCFFYGHAQFEKLKTITQDYVLCEETATQLKDGSQYLTDSVRLATMTGEQRYIDQYFNEVNVSKRRDNAVSTLQDNFAEGDSLTALQAAMKASTKLMDTEYYAMRLVEEANGVAAKDQPEELRDIKLSSVVASMTPEDKMKKARDLVSNDDYAAVRNVIDSNLDKCVNALVGDAQNEQSEAAQIFEGTYWRLEACFITFVIMTLLVAVMLRKLVVSPLKSYNESIKRGEVFTISGAWELQKMAETYNRVHEENEAIQALIRHQAEHDALTDLLNRGSFDKLLNVHESEQEEHPFALIVCDVDQFKGVNDTCGHACGDKILKRVATLLKTTFRSIDHVCRTGGDEFTIIMVEMTPDLAYTISEKIDAVNEQLAALREEGEPAVSISAGIAFTQRPNPGTSLFTDADAALYHTKEHGRCGYSFYGEY